MDKGSLKFDGVNDWVKVPHSSTLDITKAITLSSWVYAEDSQDMGILCKGAPGSSRPYVLFASKGGYYGGVIQTNKPWAQGFANATGPSGSISQKKWTHLALNYDGAHVTLYQDGKQVAKDSAVTGTGNLFSDKSEVMIGSFHNPSHGPKTRYWWKGALDEVRVYNTPLTAGQVKLLYSSAPSCNDGVQNGHETDIDCGGPHCNKCKDTKKCNAPTDCLSGVCSNKVCAKGCKHQPVVKDCYKDASGAEWCKVPGGCFTMGSPLSENCRDSDEVQHQVTLTHKFEIQATEVTQAQFTALMGYSPSNFSNCGGTCPVEMVNWHEAAAYANALSTQKGKVACYACTGNGKSVICSEATGYSGQKVYTCPGYRLPTEAEWEFAYRAGTNTAFYSGGITSCGSQDSNLDKIGWYLENSQVTYIGSSNGRGTHPVGQKTPNAWGQYDMAGNVWEWCHDWYDSYKSSSITDPIGTMGTDRVLRGGDWYVYARSARAADRFNLAPTSRYYNVGLRMIRSTP